MQLGLQSKSAEATDPPRSLQDHQVWRALVREVLAEAASQRYPPAYLKGLGRLLAGRQSIPDLQSINHWLLPTGWEAEYVAGYVPTDVYQSMLSCRVFPIAKGIRRMRDLHHSAAPDFAHDLLGHLPMLFEERYGTLLEAWAAGAKTSQPDTADIAVAEATDELIEAREQDHLEREIARRTARLVDAQDKATKVCSRRFQFETFFTWALEFGIVKGTDGRHSVIGGACLSSPGEMKRMRSGAVEYRSFIKQAVGFPVDYTVYQPVMFVAESYDELFSALAAI